MHIREITENGILFDNGKKILSSYDGYDISKGEDLYRWINWKEMAGFSYIMESDFPEDPKLLFGSDKYENCITIRDIEEEDYEIPFYEYVPAQTSIPVYLEYDGEKQDLTACVIDGSWIFPFEVYDRIRDDIRIKKVHANGIEFSNGGSLISCNQQSSVCTVNWKKLTEDRKAVSELKFSLKLSQMIELEDKGFCLVSVNRKKIFFPMINTDGVILCFKRSPDADPVFLDLSDGSIIKEESMLQDFWKTEGDVSFDFCD